MRIEIDGRVLEVDASEAMAAGRQLVRSLDPYVAHIGASLLTAATAEIRRQAVANQLVSRWADLRRRFGAGH
jgi:hypothetical protein